jgi:hypothetical protein
MCPLSDFLQQSLLDVHLLCQHNAPLPLQVIPPAFSSAASFTRGSYLMAFFVTIIWNFDRHFSLIKCRPPYLPIVTLGGTISLDMTLVDKFTPDGSSFWLFVLDARMGGVSLVCP